MNLTILFPSIGLIDGQIELFNPANMVEKVMHQTLLSPAMG